MLLAVSPRRRRSRALKSSRALFRPARALAALYQWRLFIRPSGPPRRTHSTLLLHSLHQQPRCSPFGPPRRTQKPQAALAQRGSFAHTSSTRHHNRPARDALDSTSLALARFTAR